MVLDVAVDPNILSYPVPIIMRERGAVVRQGGASLWTSGKAKPILYPLGEAEPSPWGSSEAEPSPQPSSEAELAHGRWTRRSLYFGG